MRFEFDDVGYKNKNRQCIKRSMNTRDNFVVVFSEHTRAYCNFRTKTALTHAFLQQNTHMHSTIFQTLLCVITFFTSSRHMGKMCEAAVTERKCKIKDFYRERGQQSAYHNTLLL